MSPLVMSPLVMSPMVMSPMYTVDAPARSSSAAEPLDLLRAFTPVAIDSM